MTHLTNQITDHIYNPRLEIRSFNCFNRNIGLNKGCTLKGGNELKVHVCVFRVHVCMYSIVLTLRTVFSSPSIRTGTSQFICTVPTILTRWIASGYRKTKSSSIAVLLYSMCVLCTCGHLCVSSALSIV